MLAESKLFQVVALLAGASAVSAHGHIKNWIIAGETFNGGQPVWDGYGPTAMRPTVNGDNGFVPLPLTEATRLSCGGDSAGTGLLTYPVPAGAEVTAVWDTWPDSHKGPIIEYMAACPGTTCDGVDSGSLQWFKIEEKTFDPATGTWPGYDLAHNGFKTSFKIPSDIKNGPYLVRHEVIALHGINDPQVYPYCFQAEVTGGGSGVPSETVDIVEAYTINPDFLQWNLYDGRDQTTFTPPGPAVYGGGGAGSPAPAPVPVPSASASSVAVHSASAPAPAEPSVSAPVEGSSDVPVPSNTVVPTPEESETYPSAPEVTDVEPTVPTSAVATSAVATSAVASVSAPVQPSASAPAAPSTPATGGGGGKDEDAQKCGREMNVCKAKVNALPNSEPKEAGFAACDAAATACYTSLSRKRAVINRYARRSFPAL